MKQDDEITNYAEIADGRRKLHMLAFSFCRNLTKEEWLALPETQFFIKHYRLKSTDAEHVANYVWGKK